MITILLSVTPQIYHSPPQKQLQLHHHLLLLLRHHKQQHHHHILTASCLTTTTTTNNNNVTFTRAGCWGRRAPACRRAAVRCGLRARRGRPPGRGGADGVAVGEDETGGVAARSAVWVLQWRKGEVRERRKLDCFLFVCLLCSFGWMDCWIGMWLL